MKERNAINPSEIKNKIRRRELHKKQKTEKSQAKRDRRKKAKEVEELGEDAPQKKQTKTLESTREADVMVVTADDEEVFADEAGDEFAKFWNNERNAKIMLTTRPRPSKELFLFISDLVNMLPNAFYYPRKTYTVAQITQWATNKNFTHLFVLSEKSKVCNGLIVGVLPEGPTAFFKISNVVPSADIKNSGKPTGHKPEMILNNFNTRLGHRVGRMLGSMFPHEPHFNGRQVVTFHNQRDFIFVRHHRYIFRGDKKAGDGKASGKGTRTALQELGPRFTMKMRWLQMGTFDTKFGEYEWIHKRKEMDTTRRTFHL